MKQSAHDPEKNKYVTREFWGRLRAGLQKMVKRSPNEPPPFAGNQEELSVYKVLLLWELIADKLFLIM